MLESPQNMSGIDPLVFVMGTLTDTELGLLDEYFSLLKAGFAQAEISKMMGIESYQRTLAIADKIEEELRLRQPIPCVGKKRRKRQQACDFCGDSEAIDTGECEAEY